MLIKNPFRFILALVLVGLSAFPGFSQNAEQQAILKKIARSKFGKERVDLLNNLSMNYEYEGDVENTLKYARKALYLAKQIDDKVGVAVAYSYIGAGYHNESKPAKALKYHFLSLACDKKLGRKAGIADSYINIGIIYDEQGDFRKSLHYYNYALAYSKQSKNIDLQAAACINIGITYYTLGNYPESLEKYYEALRLNDRMGDNSGKADVYVSLGNVYADQNNDSMALKMYYAALGNYKRLEDELGTGNAFVNLGLIYEEQGRFDAARFMYNKAAVLFKEINDGEGLALCYNGLGTLNYKIGKYDEALEMCNIALKISEEIGDVFGKCGSYEHLSRIYLKQGKLNKAKELLLESLNSSLKLGHKLHVRDAYKGLIELDSISHDYVAAFEHQKLWIIYRDSITNHEAENRGYQTALEYSFDKKATAQIRRHDKAIFALNERNKLSSQKQLYLVIILVVFSCSALVILYFARRSFNNRKKLSEVLANENKYKEALLQEVHHRVNNSLQMISSLLAMQGDSTDNEEIRNYLLKSENRIHAMSVMHQLLHLGNSKLEVNMLDYFNEIFDFYSTILESKPNVKLNTNIPSMFFHTKLAMPLALILNELITNSLKYAFPSNEGNIDVSLTKESDNSWMFSVKDNGIGFIQNESSVNPSSIGLNLVNLMTKQINGRINMTSTNGLFVNIRFTEK